MAGLMGIGILTTLLVREPERKFDSGNRDARAARRRLACVSRPLAPLGAEDGRVVQGAVVGPLLDFFTRYGVGLALLIFAFISTYRLTDYVMGTMTNTFYIDMGFTLTEVGVVAKFFGWPSTLVGAVVGGVIVAKIGTIRGLVARQRTDHHLQRLLCHVRHLCLRHPAGVRARRASSISGRSR